MWEYICISLNILVVSDYQTGMRRGKQSDQSPFRSSSPLPSPLRSASSCRNATFPQRGCLEWPSPFGVPPACSFSSPHIANRRRTYYALSSCSYASSLSTNVENSTLKILRLGFRSVVLVPGSNTFNSQQNSPKHYLQCFICIFSIVSLTNHSTFSIKVCCQYCIKPPTPFNMLL